MNRYCLISVPWVNNNNNRDGSLQFGHTALDYLVLEGETHESRLEDLFKQLQQEVTTGIIISQSYNHCTWNWQNRSNATKTEL